MVSFKEVDGGLNLRKFIKTSLKEHEDYDSEMMLHLILFGFMESIRSLRKLEPACCVDIGFMYLSGGIKPKLAEPIDDIFCAIKHL